VGVVMEQRVPEAVRDGLSARGHEIQLQQDWTAAVGGMQECATFDLI
jgi:hypothetical protein